MTPLKFLNNWYGAIFKEYYDEGSRYPQMNQTNGPTAFEHRVAARRTPNRTVQLSYPETYCSRIFVTKTELGPRIGGGMRTAMTYVMENAWPFAIDAVPLQFGTAQITKVTAQFYYTKHYVVQGDITKTRPFLEFGAL